MLAAEPRVALPRVALLRLHPGRGGPLLGLARRELVALLHLLAHAGYPAAAALEQLLDTQLRELVGDALADALAGGVDAPLQVDVQRAQLALSSKLAAEGRKAQRAALRTLQDRLTLTLTLTLTPRCASCRAG